MELEKFNIMSWISTKEKLPQTKEESFNSCKTSEKVLTVDQDGKVRVAELSENHDFQEWYDDRERRIYKQITHWHKLPSLPA